MTYFICAFEAEGKSKHHRTPYPPSALWDKKEMMEKGWSLDNPAYLAGANVVAALTNVPLDRAIKKTNNVVTATSQDLETWERLALLGGWQDWEIGVDEEKPSNKPQPRKSKSSKRKTIKRKTTTR